MKELEQMPLDPTGESIPVDCEVSKPTEHYLEDIQDSEQSFVILNCCKDCGEELNRSVVLTGKSIKKNWTKIVLGSGLNTKKCPNGCRSTFSDININTKLKIIEAC